ncbi:MAG: hypothetical protein QNK23_01405 [Crocinitomicaceae bacterium]|nr:hypothetical protein [Crocinitomicaceae bacterium]
MKNLLLISFMVGSTFLLNAQRYRTAVGFKGDYSTLDIASADLTLKHFFSGPNAFELNLGGSKRHFWLQAFYHRNQALTSDLEWYWGAGPDIGYWRKGVNIRGDVTYSDGFWVGLNSVIGLEYTFDFIPINLALDTGPTLRIVPDVKFGWMAGFAFRYGFR